MYIQGSRQYKCHVEHYGHPSNFGYKDIDDIRVGTDFYAISSTFQYSPGVVVLHSKDLVNWEILSHIVDDITIMTTELNWTR